MTTKRLNEEDKKALAALLEKDPQGARAIFLNKPRREPPKCFKCGNPPELYMVYAKVWQEAGLKKEENACIRCLEEKLGREIDTRDLTECLANCPLRIFFEKGAKAVKRAAQAREAEREMDAKADAEDRLRNGDI